MKNKNIDIYYFSGTGNTFLVCNMLKNHFSDKNFNVRLFPMDRSKHIEINLNNVIGLAMPSAYFSTYPFVWDFINNMPKTNGTDCFMINTMGGFSGGLLLPVKKVLKNKGYNTIGACEFIMPSNLNKKHVSNEEFKTKVETSQKKSFHFVNDLIEDRAKWSYNPIVSFIFEMLFKLANPPKRFRKMYTISVDTSKCIQCNTCYNSCPSDTIRMYEFPRFEDSCQMCMRCFSFCPVNAIYFKKQNYVPYKSAELKEILQTNTDM